MSWPIWPINYFVFAFDSMDLNDLECTMAKKYQEGNLPIYSRLDTTCILDKEVICNQYMSGEMDALPILNSKILSVCTNRALLLFYSLIRSHLFQAQMPTFDS
jgi:hypothetical protein